MITMCTRLWIFLAAAACTAEISSAQIYTNVWAVETRGSKEQIDALAVQHGFINKGQVGILEGVYEFVLPEHVLETEGQSIDEQSDEVTRSLEENDIVISVTQQVVQEMETYNYVNPTDPEWSKQWFLFNNESGVLGDKANSSRDLNVVPAWVQGHSGLNVILAVVDTGVYHNHTDIDSNYLEGIDINVMTGEEDAFPGIKNETGDLYTHGTSCAGIIAMEKNNNKCGVGVAFNSKITGILLSGGLTDIKQARALGHECQMIDIYSNSWGLKDDGKIVQYLGKCTRKTLEKATEEGRDGKGSIFVFASGNGAPYGDSCAANGYVNSIYTIGIGSAGSDGKPPFYDEKCSGKMAVAFVHNKYPLHAATITTYDECDETFDGTSAATPTVAATIALVLEANPNLTWRDVQYLIVYTSNHDILLTKSDDNKTTNAAGLAFSHQFGFGAVDAEAMVTRARHWINVPSQEKDYISVNDKIYVGNKSNATVSRAFSGNITFLEHVVVQVSLSFLEGVSDEARRGEIQLKLTSPQGTASMILPRRRLDKMNDSYTDWPFLSVHFWGENPEGNWTLFVLYGGEEGKVVVNSLTLILYGTAVTPAVIARIPKQCDAACSRGCSAPGPEFCDSCRGLRNATTLECIDECPNEYDVRDGYCVAVSGGDCVCPDDESGRCTCDDSQAFRLSPSIIVMAILVTFSGLMFPNF